MTITDLPGPGSLCSPDERRSGPREPHRLVHPDHDVELQLVGEWLRRSDVVDGLRTAVDDAIRYVLDGARTWRFDLSSDDVDSDERSSVGTKLQYHVIEQLGLSKEPPLDTTIVGLPVEIKGTVRDNWMIPREGQCEITLMIQINAHELRFRAFLMRTHRAWLTGGKGNRDLKRSPRRAALALYALEVAPWTNLPNEPLRLLNREQLSVVFGRQGQVKRLTALFGYLPGVIIPRSSIETVCATNQDPMRRARQAKPEVLAQHDLVVLVGTWTSERNLAAELGFDLGDSGWVAVPRILVESTQAGV
ncbi:hypothetical protein L5I01_26375 [Gordonia sp. HY442]|uniref:NaeI family type II restriction endonuclease n=1 Tax=Gordonia zhenghanii TaxID=2911516 RepID=UPI001F2AA46D|nr:NaeI family type II restriction endonuclease [Gordonia zhenghanii]MCF8606885.1 hypothetical protein [Gordonia zhenghanii]